MRGVCLHGGMMGIDLLGRDVVVLVAVSVMIYQYLLGEKIRLRVVKSEG